MKKMGQLIKPPPIEYGNDCGYCTPGLWPVGQTPKRMLVYFDGMTACPISHIPPPNGRTFILEQSPISACTWQYNDATWNIDYQPFVPMPNRCQIRLADHHGFFFFTKTGRPCPDEVRIFTNSFLSCAGFVGAYGGRALLSWTKELNVIIESLGIDNVHGLRYEPRIISIGSHVDKLCNLYQRTNLKLLHL